MSKVLVITESEIIGSACAPPLTTILQLALRLHRFVVVFPNQEKHLRQEGWQIYSVLPNVCHTSTQKTDGPIVGHVLWHQELTST